MSHVTVRTFNAESREVRTLAVVHEWVSDAEIKVRFDEGYEDDALSALNKAYAEARRRIEAKP